MAEIIKQQEKRRHPKVTRQMEVTPEVINATFEQFVDESSPAHSFTSGPTYELNR